jgi:hypothetical protein
VIERTSFLGLPLQTQTQRRLLVILYYALLLTLTLVMLRKPHTGLMAFLPQLFVFGGLMGGIKVGGPVKLYSEAPTGILADPQPTQLNLAQRPQRHTEWTRLDERETAQRDRAHYYAYRVLLLLLGVAALTGFLLADWAPAIYASLTGERFGCVVWSAIVLAISLPQSVLLWTEPNAPQDELVALAGEGND